MPAYTPGTSQPRQSRSLLDRQVALEYLCGIPQDKIARGWGQSIGLKEIARELAEQDDPLIKQYYERAKQGSSLDNAIHLALACEGRLKDETVQLHALQSGSIRPFSVQSRDLYDTVRKYVFAPALKNSRTAQDQERLEPTNNYERIFRDLQTRVLRKIWGKEKPGITHHPFLDVLEQAYGKGHDMVSVIVRYDERVDERLEQGALAATEKKKAVLLDAMTTLPPRRAETLRRVYGIREDGSEAEPVTQAAIARELELSDSRVGMFKREGLGRLTSMRRVRLVSGWYTDDEIEALEIERAKARTPGSIRPELIYVGEEDLTPRSINALERAGAHTLADLQKMTEADLLKKKNFGRKSLDEVKELMRGYGLSIGQALF